MSGGQVVGAKTRIPRISGLARDRIDHRLSVLWEHRLGLIVAPAGSGKTTLLAQFARASGVPVGWWRAEASDASEQSAVAHLEHALVPVLDGVRGGWSTVDDVAAALEAWNGHRALLAIDDLHSLWGTDAEAALERLLALLPHGITMFAATRRSPGFNLTRLLVSGDLLEVGPEDLRFRAWEVERLFRDYYGAPMPPDELAELARRTDGWAAGLQLFHLATRDKPATERRKVLSELGMRSRLVREYLARNVLDDLPVHVRDFLLRTCVLGRLTAALCDELTGATSSASVLDELEQRQIFTAAVDGEGSYRYHEVLRSHLEGALVEQVGELEARRRFLAAGSLLEAHGFAADALRAYGRAEAWDAVTRLLGGWSEELADRPGDWLDGLPSALVEHDPWLLLGTARRLSAQGNADDAIEMYERAEVASGRGQPVDVCRRERQALQTWFAPAPMTPSDWIAAIRLATARDPLAVATSARTWPGAEGEFVAAIALLLGGAVDDARRQLDAVAARADASPVLSIGAAIAAAAASALASSDGSVVELLDRCGQQADLAGYPWLASIARAVSLLDPQAPRELFATALPKSDPWGAALVRLFAGLGQLRRASADTDPATLLADAAAAFGELDAPVLAAWALGGVAAARGDAASGRAATLAARRAQASRAADVAMRLGARTDVAAGREPVVPAAPHVLVRCFGPFEIRVDGVQLDLSAVKPRARSLLRLLAMHAGARVHRERIIECLWPDEGDLRTGLRNLQVAISSLRQLVEPGVARGEATLIVREGDTYRFAVSGSDSHDVSEFRAACAEGRGTRATDATAAIAAYERAISLYRGELLVDEGAPEWLAADRERCALDAAEAAQSLAELALDEHDYHRAAEAAEAGLRVDPYRDGLWRVLVSANDSAGDVAAARRAEARYAEILKELGLS